MLCCCFIYQRIGMLILAVLGSFSMWAEDDLKKTKSFYQAYDQGVFEGKKDSVLGVQIGRIIDSGDLIKAKEILTNNLSEKSAPKEIINLWLAKIAIKQGRFKDFQKIFVASQVSSLHNLDLIKDVYHSLPSAQKNWLVKLLVKENFFQRKPESNCPYFELNQRNNRAQFLYELAKSHRFLKQLRKEIYYELYVLMPETVDRESLKKLADFKGFIAQLKVADEVKRMENLLIFGKNNEARQTFVEFMARNKKLTRPPCELDYVDAKVDRKMRKYDLARKRFTAIAAFCPKDMEIKARYMDLMLASTVGDEAALPNFEAFVTDYPTHSFTDDVLVFKANMLLDKGRIDEAQEVLARVIAEHPQGDMINRAYFLQAFNWAKQGNIPQAIKAFLEFKKVSPQGSLDFAQAQYWSARLSIFNDLSSLKNPQIKPEAKKQIYELAYSSEPTVYSWLAEQLLLALNEKAKPKIKDKAPKEEAPLTSFLNDRVLSLIRQSINFGFRDEALVMLGDLSLNQKEIDYAKEVAIYYDTLNRPEIGHQQLIRCSPHVAPFLRVALPTTFARISYPWAFNKEVRKTLLKVDVPKEIVFAIMRQESGFIAQSCSWAGAKGLMQLMYPSALGQAKAWALENLKEEDLYLPEVNILLASSLFKKYWQQFESLPLALAAYNAGPSMARSWSNKFKNYPLDTIIESISFKETRDYVKSVLGGIATYAAIAADDNPPRPELISK